MSAGPAPAAAAGDPPAALGQVCVQVHLDRAPGLDADALPARAEAIARATPGVRGFGASRGEESGDVFLNLVFATPQPRVAWMALEEALFGDEDVGEALEAASIVLCTADGSWDDTVVLHHYDPSVGGEA